MKIYRGTKQMMSRFVNKPTFIKELNDAIKTTGATVTAKDVMNPIYNYDDFEEISLDGFLRTNFSKEIGDKNINWWTKTNKPYAKTAFWELISTCTIDGKKVLFW